MLFQYRKNGSKTACLTRFWAFSIASKTACCPCNHKNWKNGKKNRGCFKYITIPDDYRLSIDRDCVSFKKIYALRTEAERYNARFKQTGQERAWVHSFNAVQNLNTIAHIALLAIAVAATVTHSDYSVRCLKTVKRIAWIWFFIFSMVAVRFYRMAWFVAPF